MHVCCIHEKQDRLQQSRVPRSSCQSQFTSPFYVAWGFLGGSDGKEYAYNAGDPGPKIPWGRKWLPTPVFLSEEFHGQRTLVGYSPWGCKESYTTEQLILPHSTREQTEGTRRTTILQSPEKTPQSQEVTQNEKRTFFSDEGTTTKKTSGKQLNY